MFVKNQNGYLIIKKRLNKQSLQTSILDII